MRDYGQEGSFYSVIYNFVIAVVTVGNLEGRSAAQGLFRNALPFSYAWREQKRMLAAEASLTNRTTVLPILPPTGLRIGL